ncbi:MAG: DUF1566 domain-containing protein [Rikenellaceae bacterium]|nr:DUF1566 domain-containing protein [Rikenellaceae bacterium]
MVVIMNKIRFILVAVLLSVCASAFAQLKTVAISEIIDKTHQINYETKLRLRTSLTAAINKKQGYTAMTRADISSILNEQAFQNSGLVDESTIKRLGAMTGASLILITEAIKTDGGSKIYVVVNLLDVETARVRMTENHTMLFNEIESGCEVLANKVLGISTASSSDKPVVLYGYLAVYPNDIGEFRSAPTAIINHFNTTKTHNDNGWRLPTDEELSVMRNMASQIPGFRNTRYMTSNQTSYEHPTAVRLVSTTYVGSVQQAKVDAEQAERQRAYDIIYDGDGDNGVYKIGYYHREGGVVFSLSSDGRHGKIVYATGITDSYYDAGDWKPSGGGWRLPSINELKAIYRYKQTINATFSEKGISRLESSRYWSGSASGNRKVWRINMADGYVSDNNNLNDYYHLCYVLEF